MLDIKFIRENPDLVQQNSRNRGVQVDINHLLKVDDKRKELITHAQTLQEKKNKLSKTKPDPKEIEAIRDLGVELKRLAEDLEKIEYELKVELYKIPNISHQAVVVSANEADNVVLEAVGKIREYDFEPKDHLELANGLDLVDLERGNKVTGPKFYFLKNELVFLEFALIQYSLDIIAKFGFIPILSPDLAKTSVVEGMGFNPRGESTQIYTLFNTDLSLIGTAEITLGAFHQAEIFSMNDLPKKYVAVSHCFRTEAGSYGKYAKGIFRVHQFTKVEMFCFVTPEKSEETHMELLAVEKKIWQGLGIPFRVVDHCTADLGAPSIRTFDIEAWMPGQINKNDERGDWAEVTSTSNCTDFQSRSMNIKYRNESGMNEFVHTLNGTGIADTRTMIAILENYQNKDGSIDIPQALHAYLPKNMRKIKRI